MSTGLFDDGSDAIPGGIDGPVGRVVVVGAGIAGLTVARALRQAGVEHVVLEARSRVGGRLHTADVAGLPIDLGGSWLHHPSGNPLRRFARLAGMPCHPGDPLGQLRTFDAATGSWLSAAENDALLGSDFVASLDSLRARLGPAASAFDAIEDYVSGLDASAARRARQALRAQVEADASGAAEAQSLAWLWTQVEFDDDYFGDLPSGGYSTVVDAMAARLDVRLGWPVASVELSGTGVVVRAADGRVEHGSHVVVTVPLGVLKAGSISFRPPLPVERARLVDRLGFGRYEKVVLVFERPFWRDAGWSHLVVLPPDEGQPAMWAFDLDTFGVGPALACHAFHSAVADGWPDGAVTWATGLLAAALVGPCPTPIAVEVTDWGGDACARGSYTHVTPGMSNADLDALGEPVAGRLLFAGEHTQSARLGYADGAMTSGVREAKRLLGLAAVTL